jgi:hypothetical protein
MPEQKSSDEVIAKAAKRNTFPNITTAYAVLNATSINSNTSTTIVENNKKAP